MGLRQTAAETDFERSASDPFVGMAAARRLIAHESQSESVAPRTVERRVGWFDQQIVAARAELDEWPGWLRESIVPPPFRKPPSIWSD